MKNKFTVRKTVLTAAVIILAVIYAVQLAVINRPPVKTLRLKSDPDRITVSTGAGTQTLVFENDSWLVGDKKHTADNDEVQKLVNALKEIKTLGTVSRSKAETELTRYGLNDAQTITVTAEQNGKTVRTVTIGKDSATSGQNYIKLNSSQDILLATGSLRNIFSSADEQSLRSRQIYSLNENEIQSVAIKNQSQEFTLARNSDGTWNFQTDDTITADSAKIQDWIKQIKELDAEKWAEDTSAIPENAETSTIQISAAGKNITVTCAEEESENQKNYLCSSNVTDDLFYVSSYDYDKIFKNKDDLSAKESDSAALIES